MTIEDAILHSEEVAVRNEAEAARMMERKSIVKSLNLKVGASDRDTDSFYDRLAEGALICAGQERQYAEWLRELQERRKQPEIIRCGECDYFNTGSTWCRWWARYVPKNGYCHQAAERRNDETD